ncbi:MAG: hypothetical protein WC700_07640 [Gemmatimonadaceae bacterium]|jgi:hypothetical protein
MSGDQQKPFLRRTGEHARFVARGPDEKFRKRAIVEREKLKYGDILYEEDGYRALKTYFVDAQGEPERVADIGQGSGMLTADITRLIEDPIEFYADNAALMAADISLMLLDMSAHAALIRRAAGGRDVHASRTVHANNYGDGWRLYVTRSPGDEERLSDKTPDDYLSDPSAKN